MTTFVTLAWIVIAPFIARFLTVTQILIWLTLVPYLFLPEAFRIHLPGPLDINKTVAITLGLVLSLTLHRHKLADSPKPAKRLASMKAIIVACVWVIVIGVFVTLLTNREALFFGPTVLPGMRLWDSISVLWDLLVFILPYFLAARYLATPQAHQELMKAFVIMGLLYSLLMLVEIRLSPQMHNWVYGYHQHSFLQHIRDGFRPKVFLQHGLWVGFFIFMTVMAALGLWRMTKEFKWFCAALWLFAVLAISENLGATLICVICGSIFLFTPRQLQTTFAATVAILVLIYPAARQSGLIPIQQIISLATSISADRARSLQFRLDNEDAMVARVAEKPIAGWGGYARGQIFNERGVRISVAEGRWIQTLTEQGWLGYLGFFGLLTAPAILLWLRQGVAQPPPVTVVAAFICAGNLIYMVPNSTLTPIGLLVFGSLAGYLRYHSVHGAQEEGAVSDAAPPPLRAAAGYTRFPQTLRKRSGATEVRKT